MLRVRQHSVPLCGRMVSIARRGCILFSDTSWWALGCSHAALMGKAAANICVRVRVESASVSSEHMTEWKCWVECLPPGGTIYNPLAEYAKFQFLHILTYACIAHLFFSGHPSGYEVVSHRGCGFPSWLPICCFCIWGCLPNCHCHLMWGCLWGI